MADCTGVILAGGRSTRFGADKASALWRGAPMIYWVVGALRPLCGEIVGVATTRTPVWSDHVDRAAVDDADLPEGPLRGLCAGLASCRTPLALVLGCDCPAVREPLLRHILARHARGVEAVVPRFEGYLQPLVALYSVEAASTLRGALMRGEQSVARAVERLRWIEVPEADCRRVDPEGLSFLNANRQADLALLEERFGRVDGVTRHAKPPGDSE